ncbi:hypothetical protein P615_18010 [Brevibacillus laterosporus PE36]|nr:hypothetical protein P615_18010 [Brevibacillus laterosporus PE36]
MDLTMLTPTYISLAKAEGLIQHLCPNLLERVFYKIENLPKINYLNLA